MNPPAGTGSLGALPALIGDIGGTNARFAMVSGSGAVGPVVTARTADHATIDDAIRETVLSAGEEPRSAVLALAAVIAGDRIQLTNCPWVVDPWRLIATCGFSDVVLLNDFEALALSLPALGGEDVDPIGHDRRVPEGARLVLGPGTGLGAGALVRAGGCWVPIPGEGGHLDFGPRTARDEAIWPHLTRIGGRISGESVLSGPGLVSLYGAVVRSNGGVPRFTTPAEITAAATAREDAEAEETLNLFAAYLGRYAGDLALMIMPAGGVFLGGGITARVAPFLKGGGFREGFIDKAPHRAVMEGLSTLIITHPNPALAGIAALVRDPGSFAVNLAGKRWRR